MRRGVMKLWRVAALAALSCGCSSSTDGEPPAPAGVTLAMDFRADAAFYQAPFPSDHRLVDGTVTLEGFPNPSAIPFVEALVDLLDGEARGFATTGGVFFAASAPLDASALPELDATTRGDSPIFLLGIDPESPDHLERIPVTVHHEPDGGPFGTANMLSVVPLQGLPLQPGRAYAVVVTTGLRAADGSTLTASPTMQALAKGGPVEGLNQGARATYDLALDATAALGLEAGAIAALAAFTTWDGEADMATLADHARSLPTPAPLEDWTLTEVFDEYCVYESRLAMPVFQEGEPPYDDEGGRIVFEDGSPVLDHDEEARIVVTVPRAQAPTGGWPVAVMVRTGGGGDRPLVDRGVRDAEGVVAVPGSGPALHFTRAGFAGVSVDGPHGGIRNVTGGDEQFLIFNIENPVAMRDNIRQSALELALLPDVVSGLSVPLDDPSNLCPDAGSSATFDVGTLAIMGHSMGATISPLTLAVEPRFQAVVLSGAGGSWIENVVHKQSPVPVAPLAEILLHYAALQRHVHEHDPVLTLLQWGGEPADPPIYLRERLDRDDAPDVLMLQGIVDTYILPPIANATSLSLGLDLAGPALDQDHPDLAEFRPLETVLPYRQRTTIPLPASGNRDGATAVVVQHAEGPIEDGHEVAFQTAGPKHQYRCFLETFRTGEATVPSPGAEDAPCAP